MSNTANAENQPASPIQGYRPFTPNGRRCPMTGMSHARQYQEFVHGPGREFVRVVSLARPGKRGTRLFHVGDALAYLDKLAAEQAPKTEGVK